MKKPSGTVAFPCEQKQIPLAIVPFPVLRVMVAFWCDQGLINLFSFSWLLFRFKMASKRLPGEHYTARGHCQRVQLVPAKVIVSKLVIDLLFWISFLSFY